MTTLTHAEKNLQTMRTYFDLLFGMTLEPFLNLFADDVAWFIVPTGTTVKGIEELRTMAQNHWTASPDRVKQLLNLFATDEFASLEYVTSGSLTGNADFGNVVIKAAGKRYELQCCFVFHFSPDGRIDRVHEYFDMGTVARQVAPDAGEGTVNCRD